MANFDMQPTGFSLLSGSQSFLTDLSEENESVIVGGTNYNPHKKDDSDDDSDDDNNYYGEKETT